MHPVEEKAVAMPEVANWIANLQNTIDVSGKIAEELRQRLDSVLRPEPPASAGIGALPPQAMLCTTANTLRDLCQSLDRTNDALRSILGRCEL